MADLRITDLPELLATQLSPDDPVAIVDLSASTTKKVTAANLLKDGVLLLPDNSIPADKIDGATVPDGSVTTEKLADKSVTAAKLADNSSTVVQALLPPTGDFIGQHAFVTGGPSNVFYTWDGTAWQLGGGIQALNGDDTGMVNTYVVDDGFGLLTVASDIDDTTGPGEFLAGPSGNGGEVAQRRITSPDLPTAGTDKGAVAVNGNGLVMDGDNISLDNTVTSNAGAGHLVQYNEYGLITGGGPIESSDLPISSDTNIGGVRPGTGLGVAPDGTLNHSNSVVAGTAPKITWDTEGHVTVGQALIASDIPDLDAGKITTGQFPGSRLEDGSVHSTKLADYSTCYIQPNQPPTGDYLGQMWLNPDTSQLFSYARGSAQDYWLPVGFGRLQQENLRFCGTYDAASSTILTVTDYGVSAGLALGAIPTPEDEQTGVYLLCQTPGDAVNIPNVAGKTHTEGDWIVAVNGAWEFIDVGQGSGGGGGGGGATVLNDLLDVSIDTTRMSDVDLRATYALLDGDLLVYDGSSGLWKNKPQADLAVPTKTSDLTNDGENGSDPFLSEAEVKNILDGKNPDGSPDAGGVVYLKPGDDISELTNDSGYLTSADLPTVGDGTITIQKADGTDIGSFTVNQAGNTEIKLPADTVPSVPNLQDVLDAGNSSTTEMFIAEGDGQVQIANTGSVTSTSSGGASFTGLGYRSQDWNAASAYTAYRALNYGVETFRVDTMGDIYLRRNLSIGNTGSGGDAVEGLLEVSGDVRVRKNQAQGTPFIACNQLEIGTGDLITEPVFQVDRNGGVTATFGTTAAQHGNVMPRDDWSSIPARA